MLKSAFILACAVFVSAAAGLWILSFIDRTAGPASNVAVATVGDSPPADSASTTTDTHVTAIPKDADGHFWANAVVNDKAVRFLVDTGATVVVLTPADAQRLGLTTGNLVYDHKVQTANGQTYAAHVMLTSIGVGQSKVDNVDALILKDGLTTSLLGMSYLGRLSRFEATPSSLILHP